MNCFGNSCISISYFIQESFTTSAKVFKTLQNSPCEQWTNSTLHELMNFGFMNWSFCRSKYKFFRRLKSHCLLRCQRWISSQYTVTIYPLNKKLKIEIQRRLFAGLFNTSGKTCILNGLNHQKFSFWCRTYS